MSRLIDLEVRSRMLWFSFPSDSRVEAAVRSLPGRRFDRDARRWGVPMEQIVSVVQQLEPLHFQLTPRCRDYWLEVRETAVAVPKGAGRFEVAPEDVTAKQRDFGKTVNFATIYGQGATALGQQLHVSRNEAKKLIAKYFEVYAGVRTWLDASIAGAYETGYVETLIGRRRYLPELASNNPTDRSYGERIAANTPIQGSAADLCLLTMMQIQQRLDDEGMQTRMVLQIHDELLFEAPPHEIDAAVEIVRDRMVNPYPLEVPLKVEIGTGRSWAEAH